MQSFPNLPPLPGYRYPASIISYSVWLYHRFSVSLRDVQDLLAARGVIVSHETIRDWSMKFGVQFAAAIRRKRGKPSDKWHLDEMVITIKGVKHWLWRAVDSNGDVLDVLLQSRRNKKAALRFMRKLLKSWGKPRVIITDKLGSYGAAKKDIAPSIEH